MREIKFRGRYVKKVDALYPAEDKWVYGYFYKEGNSCWIKDGKTSYRVIPKSIGQYLGREDKNGKAIYEKDVLSPNNREVVYIENGLYEQGIGFYTICRKLDRDNTFLPDERPWSLCQTQTEKSEVIGNTWESPELIGT